VPRRKTIALGFFVVLCSAWGCATVAPTLTSLAMSFAQDLIASASVNYTPRYAMQVESLLVALVNESTGLPVEEQLARTGYRPPPPDYVQRRRDEGYDGYPNGDGYGDAYGENDGYDDPYGEGSGYPGDDDYYGDSLDAGGDDGYEDPYDDGSEYPGYGDYEDPYVGDPAYPGDGDEDAGMSGEAGPGYTEYDELPHPDGGSGGVYRRRSAGAIVLDATILARRAGGDEVVPIEDGAVLFDGDGDPARGDLLRFHARVNRDCYLYVIGVDTTGFVAQIFPDPVNGLENPIAAGRDYLFPGNDQWWGLDDQPGIEHVYFVVSLTPRPDILDATRKLELDARTPAAVINRHVRTPAILPTRGLVRVQSTPVQIRIGDASAEVVPEGFSAPDDGTTITVTRWFHHD
jgi:hypothetical protein